MKAHRTTPDAVAWRRCRGAAAVAYVDRIETNRAFATAMHTEALRSFQSEVAKRYPRLPVELGIMELSGAVEVVA